MNTKNNKRRQASQEKIRSVFFELLGKKELVKIKVSEICLLAGINRSTFYANYLDIYDLADKICIDLQNEVTDIFGLHPDLADSESSFLELFHHIKENRQYYSLCFKLGFEGRALRTNAIDISNSREYAFVDYRLIFFQSGFNAIVKAWLENDCKETPEEMCAVLLHEYRGRRTKPISN